MDIGNVNNNEAVLLFIQNEIKGLAVNEMLFPEKFLFNVINFVNIITNQKIILIIVLNEIYLYIFEFEYYSL